MQLSEKQLNKYMEIYKEYYPNVEFSKQEALGDALKLLDLINIIYKYTIKYEKR